METPGDHSGGLQSGGSARHQQRWALISAHSCPDPLLPALIILLCRLECSGSLSAAAAHNPSLLFLPSSGASRVPRHHSGDGPSLFGRSALAGRRSSPIHLPGQRPLVRCFHDKRPKHRLPPLAERQDPLLQAGCPCLPLEAQGAPLAPGHSPFPQVLGETPAPCTALWERADPAAESRAAQTLAAVSLPPWQGKGWFPL